MEGGTGMKAETGTKKLSSKSRNALIGKIVLYVVLLIITALMVVPFLWMLSASIKSNREVFIMDPFVWIPEVPRWQNYVDIWTKIPLLKFVQNTVILTIIVTFLQLLTSSFAAYSFSKLEFKHKNTLFLAYIATIAMPWQVYMVPQFIMMRGMGLNDKLLAMICLQAFSAFGVFMMKQFYDGIPTDLCEAARIDGMSEYKIYSKIMLPLSKPALSTLTIFTFVNTWNDYLGPLIYLKTETKKTIQLGLKMFIGQYSAEYGLIMAGSVLSLIPVIVVFLCLQKYFVEGVAATGLKG
jgi:multiple sugar transport system permease protein